MTFHPTLDEIRKAAETIGGVIPLPTPLLFSSGLSKALGAEVFLKLETMTPIGSFKLRGGIHLISEMHSSHRASGVITACCSLFQCEGTYCGSHRRKPRQSFID